MSKTHELKTDPAVFAAVLVGQKTHEIRFNDRGFAVGDTLLLRETTWTGEAMRAGAPLVYTGRTDTRTVSHILTGYGLADGWCILSFAARPVADAVAWRMVTPEAGNVVFLEDATEAARYKAVDGREVRPLGFIDRAPQGKPEAPSARVFTEDQLRTVIAMANDFASECSGGSSLTGCLDADAIVKGLTENWPLDPDGPSGYGYVDSIGQWARAYRNGTTPGKPEAGKGGS